MNESLSFWGLMEFFHHCIPNFTITDRLLYQAGRETLPWGPHLPSHYTTPLLLKLWGSLPTVPAVVLPDYIPPKKPILSPLYRWKFQSGYQSSSPTSWAFESGLWHFSVQTTRPHCLWVAVMHASSISSSWTHVTGSSQSWCIPPTTAQTFWFILLSPSLGPHTSKSLFAICRKPSNYLISNPPINTATLLPILSPLVLLIPTQRLWRPYTCLGTVAQTKPSEISNSLSLLTEGVL